MNYKINEIFQSIQGEGLLVGKIMNFIRFCECNLSCKWCDTSFRDGKEMSLDTILKRMDTKWSWVALTGGEPLLEKNLDELICALGDAGFYVLLETNGTVYNPDVMEKCTFISADIKPPSSGNAVWNEQMLGYCMENPDKTQVKVVLQDSSDLVFFKKIYKKEYPNWILQPEHSMIEKLDYENIIKNIEDNVRIIPQIHKILEVR